MNANTLMWVLILAGAAAVITGVAGFVALSLGCDLVAASAIAYIAVRVATGSRS